MKNNKVLPSRMGSGRLKNRLKNAGFTVKDTGKKDFEFEIKDWNLKSAITIPRCVSKYAQGNIELFRGWEYSSLASALIIPRHTRYNLVLDATDYVQDYCSSRLPPCLLSKNMIIAYEGNTTKREEYGFWVIDANEADFVYAILKSSMFKAWCELTACTSYTDSAGTQHRGEQHFTEGMWGTFPMQDPCTPLSKFANGKVKNLFASQKTVEEAIALAGKWRSKGWASYSPLTTFDECMDELCGFGNISSSGYTRKQILAEGFLDAFYGQPQNSPKKN